MQRTSSGKTQTTGRRQRRQRKRVSHGSRVSIALGDRRLHNPCGGGPDELAPRAPASKRVATERKPPTCPKAMERTHSPGATPMRTTIASLTAAAVAGSVFLSRPTRSDSRSLDATRRSPAGGCLCLKVPAQARRSHFFCDVGIVHVPKPALHLARGNSGKRYEGADQLALYSPPKEREKGAEFHRRCLRRVGVSMGVSTPSVGHIRMARRAPIEPSEKGPHLFIPKASYAPTIR